MIAFAVCLWVLGAVAGSLLLGAVVVNADRHAELTDYWVA